MARIKNRETGEYYSGGYGTEKGPQWTKSTWTCRDYGTYGSDAVPTYEGLKKMGLNVVIEE
jgi:hypothetical protein